MKFGYKSFLKIVIASTLIIASPIALAASEETSWMTYMYIGLAISLVAATIIVIRNKSEESLMVKVMIGGVYFWVITFIQLIVFAAISYFNK